MKYTVRRHLGRGKNYGDFQIRGYVTDSKQGDVIEYVNPNEFNIQFHNVKLFNKVNPSLNIFTGKTSKMPCAWLIFDSYTITPKQSLSGEGIQFNPKANPFWTDSKGQNIDGKSFTIVNMNSNKLYV
mgnify:FL=1|tara:strand:+ start:3342 stop:3722 length:381 start_codon:yes stop_codon:yes gene_type:complete